MTSENTPYQKYLRDTCNDVSKVHNGYFSVDKKGRCIDSKLKRGSEFSDDISAYDLILKNKERLLSFEEPTRFIFSHSSLREGWDNPNVFQICTLNHADSSTAKRQEVGRGLRLCVNQDGNRMDYASCGDRVHDINLLTVIASESYKDFVDALQKDTREAMYDRPKKATKEYFESKYVMLDGEAHRTSGAEAQRIYNYMIRFDYMDDDGNITAKYRTDAANHTLVELPIEIRPMTEDVHKLIQAIYDDNVFDSMITNAH